MATKNRRRPKNFKNERSDKESSKEFTNKKNDSSWYTRNQQLALDAGRYSFTWPTGAAVDFDVQPFSGVTTTVFNQADDTMHFPGVMSLDFVPSYGVASDAQDPINVSMFNIYSYVRHANSGHSNYDAPDLMLYLMAMDNIYMLYQHMVRAYGLIRVFAQRNRHYPQMLFNALNLDYDDLLLHISDFRAYINTCALKIGSLCVPATMPLFLRHMWMCSGVYADAPSVKSQVYLFRPSWIGKYNEKTSTYGGYLEGDSTLTTTKCGFSQLKTLFDDLVSRVIQSEDCNIMSGDILKAYGQDNLFKVAMIGDDYTVEPVFNPEVLRQIQNATLIKDVALDSYNTTAVMLYQDPNVGILKSAFTLGDNCVHIAGKRILTGSDESPTPEEVLVNSRLMVTADEYTLSGTSTSNTKITFVKPHYGTEIIQNARVYDFDNPTGERIYYGRPLGSHYYASNVRQVDYRVGFYNYHPLVGVETQVYTSNVLTSADWEYDFDVDDYAIVDNHDVDKMHLTALLSLFDVPQMGRVQ